MKIIISIIVIFFYIIAIANAGATNITYKSYIDNSYGFYKIRDITTQKPVLYDDRTLIINQEDAVIWINDVEDKSMTLINEQNLWESDDVYLVASGQFKYRFKIPGEYTFYIKEFPSARQTIIVNSIEPIIVSTAIPTEAIIPTTTPVITLTTTPVIILTTTPVITLTTTPVITPILTETKNMSSDKSDISSNATSNMTLKNTTLNEDSSMPKQKITVKTIILTILGILIVARRIL